MNIPNLPIREKAKELKELLQNNQVVVVAGETGSGKTTQLPRICLEMGFAKKGKIAVTQPRRIAATSTAKRVAEEESSPLGQKVGYKIRFAEKSSDNTEILFMTDGMLLNELSHDKNLSAYSTIIIDEAHERSLNIDFLLGYLRKLLPKREDLKLIISSATIDTDLFSEAFDNAPILEVSGRMFPVEIIYDPIEEKDTTYIEKTIQSVDQILGADMGGDILIFMPTERDILETVERLKGRKFSNSEILPLFARLTRFQQNRIFESTSRRKIVVSTNLAETSLTVPGIRFVIDSGLARVSRYAPNLRTNRLPVEQISQAEAKQRMGRCGRVAEGICIRLYSEKEFTTMEEYRTAEIQRSNLAGVILTLLNLRLGTIETFPFLEAPEQRSIGDAFSQLYELGAINEKRYLTKMGRFMARLPLEPHISRMILQASTEGVVDAISIIAAGLSVMDPRERPQEQQAEADLQHQKFLDGRSDFLTLLKLWESYHKKLLDLKTQNRMRKYCKEHFLSYNKMQEWGDVHRQIIGITRERKIRGNSEFTSDNSKVTAIHRSILSGLVSSIAKWDKEAGAYRATRNRLAHIFPGSVLAKKKKRPDWMMAQEIVETSRTFARSIAPIDPRWIEDFVPHLLKRTYGVPYFDAERASVLIEEKLLFSGLTIIEGRTRFYGKIDMKDAKEIFIRQALIEGQMARPLPFLRENLKLMEELTEEEAKLRDKGYLVSEDVIYKFYDEKLPDLASVRDLVGFIKKNRAQKILLLKREDLLIQNLPDTMKDFPNEFALGDKQFPLHYTYNPGAEDDGVTVTVPLGEVAFIKSDTFDWIVPALWAEKVTWLLKSLPKAQRKQFVPANEAALKIAKTMSYSPQGFIPEMIEGIKKSFGITFQPANFSDEKLPEHLKMRIRVQDKKGKVLRESRCFDELIDVNSDLAKNQKGSIEKSLHKAQKKGIKEWDFGNLPQQKEISTSKDGFTLYGYPALSPDNDSVTLIYKTTPEEAIKIHRKGVSKLLEIYLQRKLDWLYKDLKFPKKLKLLTAPLGGEEKIKKRLYEIIKEEIILSPPTPPTTKADFEKLLETKISQLYGVGFTALATLEDVLLQTSENRAKIKKLLTKFSGRSFIILGSELRGEMELYMEQFTEGFFPFPLLIQFNRYMKAFAFRIEKAFLSTAQYRKQEEKLLHYQNRLVELTEKWDKYSSSAHKEIVDYSVMVEEFAIQLFAHPNMKANIPISEKRLDKQLDSIEGGTV